MVSIPSDQPSNGVLANYRWIGPDYFTTIQQHILEGRALDEHDRNAKNAVISEATAKAVWPDQSPLGRQFKRNGNNFTVVGIVADAHNNSLRAAPVNMVYLPYWDNPPWATYFLVRSTQDPHPTHRLRPQHHLELQPQRHHSPRPHPRFASSPTPSHPSTSKPASS